MAIVSSEITSLKSSLLLSLPYDLLESVLDNVLVEASPTQFMELCLVSKDFYNMASGLNYGPLSKLILHSAVSDISSSAVINTLELKPTPLLGKLKNVLSKKQSLKTQILSAADISVPENSKTAEENYLARMLSQLRIAGVSLDWYRKLAITPASSPHLKSLSITASRPERIRGVTLSTIRSNAIDKYVPLLLQLRKEYKSSVQVELFIESFTLLCFAINYKFESAALQLIRAGINVDTPNLDTKFTPLMYSVQFSMTSVTAELIKRGVNLLAIDKQGLSALDIAFFHLADTETLKILLEAEPIMNDPSFLSSRFPIAVSAGNSNQVLTMLMDAGADVNGRLSDGRTAIFLAAGFGIEGSFDFLVENGADINAVDNNLRTPLINALQTHENEIATKLINLGANLTCRDIEGNSALSFAVKANLWSIVDILIAKGASIDEKNNNGETPLMISMKNSMEHSVCVAEFVKRGANLNIANNQGKTALDMSYFLPEQSVQYLIDHGAKHGAVDDSQDDK